MATTRVHAAQVSGLKTDIIDVEVDISKGIRSFSIIGLPDKAVEEARGRIEAAIKNSGFVTPLRGSRKIIVALAPADIRKEGPVFDLAIALANLAASKTISFDPKKKLFLGELSLDGSLRRIQGALLLAKRAKEEGFTELFLPKGNAREAALIEGLAVYGAETLRDVVRHLTNEPNALLTREPITKIRASHSAIPEPFDFSLVKGQETAKRGLEIAAAGGHNLAMSGPPGTGKTLLARAFAGILPNLTPDETLDVTGIHSSAGILKDDYITAPPFRSPHHTSSYVSVVGGGVWPKPGEITLAHHGVLFLDEFPEFERRVIESLREPLEERAITVARAKGSMRFPARFILIAAMNPCPCGNRGRSEKACICPESTLERYRRKISGSIADRIDIWLDVPHIDPAKLSGGLEGEKTAVIRKRVEKTRSIQKKRFTREKSVRTNSDMGVKELKKYISLSDECTALLNSAANRLDLSARSYHRIVKLARTIADMSVAREIKPVHILEALQYRPKS